MTPRKLLCRVALPLYVLVLAMCIWFLSWSMIKQSKDSKCRLVENSGETVTVESAECLASLNVLCDTAYLNYTQRLLDSIGVQTSVKTNIFRLHGRCKELTIPRGAEESMVFHDFDHPHNSLSVMWRESCDVNPCQYCFHINADVAFFGWRDIELELRYMLYQEQLLRGRSCKVIIAKTKSGPPFTFIGYEQAFVQSHRSSLFSEDYWFFFFEDNHILLTLDELGKKGEFDHDENFCEINFEANTFHGEVEDENYMSGTQRTGEGSKTEEQLMISCNFELNRIVFMERFHIFYVPGVSPEHLICDRWLAISTNADRRQQVLAECAASEVVHAI